jgi:outer membrane murein-binding lipoprotein Lpp
MRANIVLVAVACLVIFTTVSLRADEPSGKEQASAKENAQLKAQVEALKAEVKALREQLQARPPQLQVVPYGELKGLPGGLRFAPPATVPVPPGAVVPEYGPVQGMPEGTVKRQFNGLTYYVIPMRGAAGEK